jgi:hypothetical protein
MNDRRRDNRNRTLLGGKIIFNNRQSVIDCIVRNRSDTGACLQLNSPIRGQASSFAKSLKGRAEKVLPPARVRPRRLNEHQMAQAPLI